MTYGIQPTCMCESLLFVPRNHNFDILATTLYPVKSQNSPLSDEKGDTKNPNVNRRADGHFDPFYKVISEK